MSNDLLGEHPDGHYNARINWDRVGFNVPNAFSRYAESYKRAADVLVETSANSTYDSNALVYAILFCYRHYVELKVKGFVVGAGELLDQELALPMKHDLWTLWRKVRPLLEEVWDVSGPNEDFDATEEVIKQLHDLDGGSYAFRYPVDTNMNRSLPSGIRYINVKQVSEVIGRIAPFLDGNSDAIGEFLDAKYEMQAEAHKEAMQYAEPPDYE
ncbi:MAG: hypothetical protein Q7R32_07330 [Dehalococcoidia bacterium]|nr:hypothetical protein [Dehalococcoidia bacterium]